MVAAAREPARWPGLAWAVWDAGQGEELYAGGTFARADGVWTRRIARWDGQRWARLGEGIFGADTEVRALVPFDDGSGEALYVGGEFNNAGGVATFHVARWDGATWSAVGPNGLGPGGFVTSLVSFDDGSGARLYAAGSFPALGARVATWDGTGWAAVGSFDAPVEALASHDDGSGAALYAGGDFRDVNGQPAAGVARWDGASWSAVGLGLDAEIGALGTFDDGSGPSLFAAGADIVARWDGSSWTRLAAAPDGRMLALEAFTDAGGATRLFVGGRFDRSVDGALLGNIAAWDGARFSQVGGRGRGTDGRVRALAYFQAPDDVRPTLYAGGDFEEAGAGRAKQLARLRDGNWEAFASVNATNDDLTRVQAIEEHDDGSGSALWIAGGFRDVDGVPANGIARWDGTSWSSPGAGVVGGIATMTSWPAQGLFVGGTFDTLDGAPAQSVALWDGQAWNDLGPVPWRPFAFLEGGPQVFTSALWDDGSGEALYVAGSLRLQGHRCEGHLPLGWDVLVARCGARRWRPDARLLRRRLGQPAVRGRGLRGHRRRLRRRSRGLGRDEVVGDRPRRRAAGAILAGRRARERALPPRRFRAGRCPALGRRGLRAALHVARVLQRRRGRRVRAANR